MTDEYPVGADLAKRTARAARLARRRRFTVGGAVCSLAALTAAVAFVFFVPGPLNAALGGNVPARTAAMIGAPEPTDGGGNQLPPPDTTELPCNAVPLRGGDYSKWTELGIGGDGTYNVPVEPGKLDETLAQYGLEAASYDSQAAGALDALRGGGRELRLVLFIIGSGTVQPNAVALTLENGAAVFELTNCLGENPRLYSRVNFDMACQGFLVEIPSEAVGLPFSSRHVPWDDLPAGKKTQIMLNRILRNPDMAGYLNATPADSADVPELFLTKSPMETAGILSLGREALDWLEARCEGVKADNSKATMEYAVLSCLIGKLQAAVSYPPGPMNTPHPTPALADKDPMVTESAETDGVLYGCSVDAAFQHDLDTHLLSQGGRALRDGEKQYSAFMYLMEPLDSGRFTAAVLASERKPGGKPSEPQLYIVQAEYQNRSTEAIADWRLRDWTTTPTERPGMAEYPSLLHRSWDRELFTLYGAVNGKLAAAGAGPFEIRLDNAGGQTASAMDLSGTLRWFRLSEWVQRERGAGSQNYGLQTLDFPSASAAAWKLEPLSGGKWKKTTEGSLGRLSRADRVGLQSVNVETVVAADGGIWYDSYELNPSTKAVTLWRCFCNLYGQASEPGFYVCTDKAVYNSMMAMLNVDTDVSDLIVADDTPRFKLPLDREELGYIVALVQDMPGGIAAIHPAIEYNGGWPEKSLPAVSKKSTVISWAKRMGEVLGYMDKPGTSPMEQIDSLPQDMALDGPAGSPKLLRWDFDVAAQEGKAALTLYANPATGQVWSALEYRLFGSTEVSTCYMKTRGGDKTLYLLLTELTFGREIEKPEGLPR